jgi:hypothetical protein
MATTKRGLDDGHVPGSKRRAPDPYEYERICDLPDALDCFADPRARSTPNGSAVSPHPSSAMPCQLGGHEPSRSPLAGAAAKAKASGLLRNWSATDKYKAAEPLVLQASAS